MPTAGRFPDAWLADLQSRADIVEVISPYVALKKNGRNYWGLCPLHGEKTPSFSVDPEKQMYYCFGCKKGGSAIGFLMEMERLTFSEAVKRLADTYHIPLPELERDEEYQRRQTQRQRLLEANLEAARFYNDMLYLNGGAKVLTYLKGRGLSDGIIRKFGLGAAPEQWDALTKHLTEKGFTRNELVLAGLTLVKEADPSSGRPERSFDMFRNRAIFPIIDPYGHVLGFGGRSLDESLPKYLNTADTPVFNKRKGVYAANLLHKERHLERVILVEGYMDVVSLTQFGVKGVVATLGTALTPEQAQLLHRYAPVIHLGYDGDSPGQNAILKGLSILKDADYPAKVLDFPDGLDPDEFIRRDGLEGFEALPAISPETYRMRRLKEQFDLSTEEGRVNYAKACAQILKGLEPVDLEFHLRELSMQTGFPRDVLIAQIQVDPAKIAKVGVRAQTAAEKIVGGQAKSKASGTQNNSAANRPGYGTSDSKPLVPPPRTEPVNESVRIQEELISILATGLLPGEPVVESDFTDELLKDVFLQLQKGEKASSVLAREEDEIQRDRLARLFLEPKYEDSDQLLRMTEECLSKLRLSREETRSAGLLEQIRSASADEKTALMQEYQACMSRIRAMKKH